MATQVSLPPSLADISLIVASYECENIPDLAVKTTLISADPKGDIEMQGEFTMPNEEVILKPRITIKEE